MTVPIIGIDPSATSTGIAWTDGTTDALQPPARLRAGERLHWIDGHLSRGLRLHPPLPTIAILEDYGPISTRFGKTALRLGEVGGIIRALLWRHNVTLVEIPPTRLKRWATGNGTAGKDAMAEALPPGASTLMRTDDEVDAWWLRHLGDHGINGTPLDRCDRRYKARLDVLSLIDWPAT